MADSADTTTPQQPGAEKPRSVNGRMRDVVRKLKSVAMTMPRFRPQDVVLSQQFDEMFSDVMDCSIELSALAAVDRHATAVALELHKNRKEFQFATAQLRDQADALSRAQGNAISKQLLPGYEEPPNFTIVPAPTDTATKAG